MKRALSAGLMLIFSLFGPNSGDAEPMTTSTPTTKILAIGTINPGVVSPIKWRVVRGSQAVAGAVGFC